MFTDEPTSPHPTLADLIARSPRGLEARRVISWARQLAPLVDADPGGVPGNLDPRRVVIGPGDHARLAAPAPGDEQALLLAGSAKRADLVRDFAAMMYEAIGGTRPGTSATPIVGATVQVNLALLAGLSDRPEARPRSARALVAMLEGGDPAVAPTALKATPRRVTARSAPPGLSLTAGAAVVVSAIAAGWAWIGPQAGAGQATVPPAGQEQGPLAGEQAAVREDLRAGFARQARNRWLSVLAGEPAPLFLRLRPRCERIKAGAGRADDLLAGGRYDEARRIYERSAAAMSELLEQHRDAEQSTVSMAQRWAAALAATPDGWIDDDAVAVACADAETLGLDAARAAARGDYLVALATYDDAVAELERAVGLNDRRIEARLAEARRLRDDGRYESALERLESLSSLCDESVIRAERVETYLSVARARGGHTTIDEARSALDAVLELDPRNAEAMSLRSDASALERPRHGTILVNSLSQTLLYVGPGRFQMGSPRTELFHQPTERQHAVVLTRGFWIGRIEVTRGQFRAFVAAAGYVTDAETEGWSLGVDKSGRWQRVEGLSWRDAGFAQTDNHPVVCVSHRDAEAFCRWLSDREGRGYRLPTEAEWEYGCRAGSANAYAWGADPYEERARANAADLAWMRQVPELVGFQWLDGHVHTSPVACFPANAWGLFDMHGNVQEWCGDVYAPYPAGEVTDPAGPTFDIEDAPRVLRGGSFAALPAQCRSAHRDASRPGSSFVTTGFRVVMEGGAGTGSE